MQHQYAALSRRKVLGLGIAAFALPSASLAETTTAGIVMDRFLALNNSRQLRSPEGQKLTTGRAIDWQDGLPALPAKYDKLIAVNESLAVARVVAATGDGGAQDIYFYLNLVDGGWKVSDFRTLWLPPLIYKLQAELKSRLTLSSEEAATLRNLDLTLSSDAVLANWLGTHLPQMNELAQLSRAGANSYKLKAACFNLDLSSAERKDDLVIITIGGMSDNTVGFLNPGSSVLPTITPSEYIWIEPLVEGWALFKTT